MTLRFLTTMAAALTMTMAMPSRAGADGDARGLEVKTFVGGWFGLGQGSRNEFKDSPLAGVQLAYEVHPNLALVGTLSWTLNNAKRLSNAKLDFVQYDAGLRLQHAYALSSTTFLRPALGVGAGLRSLHFRDAAYQGGTSPAFYSSAGVELAHRSVAAGITLRHEMSTPEPTSLEMRDGNAKHDLALAASIGLRF